jgi:hypothetical protein
MAINRASIAKQLLPGLNAVFGIEYGEVADEYSVLYEVENSDRAFEEEVLFTGFGEAPVKGEGAAVQYDNAQESYTSRYTAETIALAFSVTEEAMEDNLYDTFAKLRARGLARSMASTKQTKAAQTFNQGFAATITGGDGQPMFSASHPTVGDGSEAALETALVSIQTLKDDRGILIGAGAQSLHVAPSNQFTADRVLNSPYQSNTADNNINSINHQGMLPSGYMVNKRFSDPDAFFIRTDVPNGTKMFIRAPLATKMEPDFDTGNLRFKARERYSFGWSDWRGYFGSQGA